MYLYESPMTQDVGMCTFMSSMAQDVGNVYLYENPVAQNVGNVYLYDSPVAQNVGNVYLYESPVAQNVGNVSSPPCWKVCHPPPHSPLHTILSSYLSCNKTLQI